MGSGHVDDLRKLYAELVCWAISFVSPSVLYRWLYDGKLVTVQTLTPDSPSVRAVALRLRVITQTPCHEVLIITAQERMIDDNSYSSCRSLKIPSIAFQSLGFWLKWFVFNDRNPKLRLQIGVLRGICGEYYRDKQIGRMLHGPSNSVLRLYILYRPNLCYTECTSVQCSVYVIMQSTVRLSVSYHPPPGARVQSALSGQKLKVIWAFCTSEWRIQSQFLRDIVDSLRYNFLPFFDLDPIWLASSVWNGVSISTIKATRGWDRVEANNNTFGLDTLVVLYKHS